LAELQYQGKPGSGTCPWGESAENLRMLYLAATVRAALGDKKAHEESQRILTLLLGPGPKRGRKNRKS